jgi:anti-sigma B factor antagonist
VDITTHPDGDAIRLAVTGEVDMATAGDLENAINDAAARTEIATVVVDLADVTFCDSGGIAALVRTHADAATRGTVMKVTNPRGNVRLVMEITCVLDALTNPPTL